MEWQKTTFGELKAGDAWTYEYKNKTFHIEVSIKGEHDNDPDDSCPVYHLVSPEREALEKIVGIIESMMYPEDKLRESRVIAKSALEVKP